MEYKKRTEPTKKQKKVFDFIVKYKAENGMMPTYQEIGTALKLKTSSAFVLIQYLEKLGYVKRSRLARSIQILK